MTDYVHLASAAACGRQCAAHSSRFRQRLAVAFLCQLKCATRLIDFLTADVFFHALKTLVFAFGLFHLPFQRRGFCLGGGMAIALQADFRIASDDARFGIPASKLGRIYSYDLIAKLISLIGESEARMMLLLGEPMNAAEALRITALRAEAARLGAGSTVATSEDAPLGSDLAGRSALDARIGAEQLRRSERTCDGHCRQRIEVGESRPVAGQCSACAPRGAGR